MEPGLGTVGGAVSLASASRVCIGAVDYCGAGPACCCGGGQVQRLRRRSEISRVRMQASLGHFGGLWSGTPQGRVHQAQAEAPLHSCRRDRRGKGDGKGGCGKGVVGNASVATVEAAVQPTDECYSLAELAQLSDFVACVIPTPVFTPPAPFGCLFPVDWSGRSTPARFWLSRPHARGPPARFDDSTQT